MKSKIWAIAFLLYVSLLFLLVGGLTGIIDPFFHYHKPLASLEYPLDSPQYQNDGIARHFDYNALIVGTSMTDNFRSSELDSLFQVNSVKISTPGGKFAEIKHYLQTALESNPDIKLVILAYDTWFTEAMLTGEAPSDGVPLYLYDRNVFNDVNYLLNKEILFSHALEVLQYTRQGNVTTTFDDYNNWRYFRFGKEEALKNHTRPEQSDQFWTVTPEYLSQVEHTVTRELVSVAQAYPDTTFCIYIPPYSALFWDKVNRHNSLENDVQVLKTVSAALLQAENIRLYSFQDDYEIVTDLDNYRDECHHTSEVNSRILTKIHAGEHQLTLDNYEAYWNDFLAFYRAFDFEALFQS